MARFTLICSFALVCLLLVVDCSPIVNAPVAGSLDSNKSPITPSKNTGIVPPKLTAPYQTIPVKPTVPIAPVKPVAGKNDDKSNGDDDEKKGKKKGNSSKKEKNNKGKGKSNN